MCSAFMRFMFTIIMQPTSAPASRLASNRPSTPNSRLRRQRIKRTQTDPRPMANGISQKG